MRHYLLTHSSIALTDAFRTEIAVLRRELEIREEPESETKIITAGVAGYSAGAETFGAAPAEILNQVFDAPLAIGERAAEYLETILLFTEDENVAEVESYWQAGGQEAERLLASIKDKVYRRIYSGETASQLKQRQPLETDQQRQSAQESLKARLKDVLATLKESARTETLGTVTFKLVTALKALESRLGSGYYRFEIAQRIVILSSQQANINSATSESLSFITLLFREKNETTRCCIQLTNRIAPNFCKRLLSFNAG